MKILIRGIIDDVVQNIVPFALVELDDGTYHEIAVRSEHTAHRTGIAYEIETVIGNWLIADPQNEWDVERTHDHPVEELDAFLADPEAYKMAGLL